MFQAECTDRSNPGSLGIVDDERRGSCIDVVAENGMAPGPFALAPGGGDLVAGPLGNELAFELGKLEQYVQDQPTHRRGRVELLRYGDKSDVVLFERGHEAGEVQ